MVYSDFRKLGDAYHAYAKTFTIYCLVGFPYIQYSIFFSIENKNNHYFSAKQYCSWRQQNGSQAAKASTLWYSGTFMQKLIVWTASSCQNQGRNYPFNKQQMSQKKTTNTHTLRLIHTRKLIHAHTAVCMSELLRGWFLGKTEVIALVSLNPAK